MSRGGRRTPFVVKWNRHGERMIAQVTGEGKSGLRFTDEKGREYFCWDPEKMAAFIDWVEGYEPENPIWEEIENAFKRTGMGERELASMVGVSTEKVRDWISGTCRPSKPALRKIKEAIADYERQVRSGQ